MRIAVCTTLAAYVMDQRETWESWIANADMIRARAKISGHEAQYFAAIEVDARGLDPFADLLTALCSVSGEWWTYSLDDGRTEVTSHNRLRHLTMGQNLASEYANAGGFDWMLFMGADTAPPDDVIPKLLEADHPLIGAEVPTYCLGGPVVDGYDFPVQEQMNTTSALMIRRDVFKRLRWRYDVDLGLTDDPAYQLDAQELLNVPSYCRKDCVAQHYPGVIYPIELRFPDRDMTVYRHAT